MLHAFELGGRKDVGSFGAFLVKNGMTVIDPPGEYYDRSYYAVYLLDPDGMKLESMVCKPGRNLDPSNGRPPEAGGAASARRLSHARVRQ